jgi:DNA-binding GntR family transcriptional regulator
MAQSDIVPVAEPLYEQVYRIFRARIIGGQWKPQSLLPGEVMLSHELGVSVGTVRKAMDQLARDNLVIRERGRGTFVRGDEEWKDGKGLKLLDRLGRPISPVIELTGARMTTATPFEAKLLRIAPARASTQGVITITRAWRTGTLLVNLERIVVEAGRFPDLVQHVGRDGEVLNKAYVATVLERIERTVWLIGCQDVGEAGEPDDRRDDAPGTTMEMTGSILRLGSHSVDARGIPVELGRHLIQLDNCALQLNG